ncbi:MAG: formate/nitrite transporter family protein [Dokdonella sp.]|uniref:formate/nitrite transporter family protein n=1 Tax=Dokdonella sp. TaxID=2291710 RepID=UPI0032636D61
MSGPSRTASTKAPAKRAGKRVDDPSKRASDASAELSKNEKSDVEEKRPPRPAVMHEVIRREGEHELRRNVSALAFSSLAAGLTMGFSLVARALLHRHFGDIPGRFLLESLGYSVGFVIVIAARQQLFTENTMTAVLPLMSKPSWEKFGQLLRLWGVVLLGNVVGVALFAYGLLHLQQFDAETQETFRDIGKELMQNSVWQMFTKGILAGWLIATMVWMLAAIEQSKLAIIVSMTTLIAIGGFTHIIVGSVETLYLVFNGDLSWGGYVFDFALPALAGNIVGGSGIFALISHAQVRSDRS